MNAWIVFQRMLVLLAMMLVGFFSYKKGVFKEKSLGDLSKFVVNIVNPLLVIDGVLGKDSGAGSAAIRQNILMMIIYYIILLVISIPVASLLKVKKSSSYLYQLMMIFSNVGFMGIPVITSLYGDGCVLYIAFYILGYNLLLYTYGLFLVDKSVRYSEGDPGASGHKDPAFNKVSLLGTLGKIFNAGVIACILAVLIFAFSLKVPQPAQQFVSMLGSCAVPLSMVLIGASMAQQSFKTLLTDKKVYLFLTIRMIVMPIIAALIVRNIAFDRQVIGVFGLMMAMPIGSIVVLLAKQQGADETVCTRASVISTLASVITIPLVAAFLP